MRQSRSTGWITKDKKSSGGQSFLPPVHHRVPQKSASCKDFRKTGLSVTLPLAVERPAGTPSTFDPPIQKPLLPSRSTATLGFDGAFKLARARAKQQVVKNNLHHLPTLSEHASDSNFRRTRMMSRENNMWSTRVLRAVASDDSDLLGEPISQPLTKISQTSCGFFSPSQRSEAENNGDSQCLALSPGEKAKLELPFLSRTDSTVSSNAKNMSPSHLDISVQQPELGRSLSTPVIVMGRSASQPIALRSVSTSVVLDRGNSPANLNHSSTDASEASLGSSPTKGSTPTNGSAPQFRLFLPSRLNNLNNNEINSGRDVKGSPRKAQQKPSSGKARQAGKRVRLENTKSEPKPEADTNKDSDLDLKQIASFIASSDPNQKFSAQDVKTMKDGFNRFTLPGDPEIHEDDLCLLLAYLGHLFVDVDDVMSILRTTVRASTLDFNEFIQFMPNYLKYESDKFRSIFRENDDDGSGEIDAIEVRKITKALGYFPRYLMIQETLEAVDIEHNGSLTFDELIHFFALYRRNQSFTKNEIADLKYIFNHFARDNRNGLAMLPCDSLAAAIEGAFGLQAFEEATEVAKPLCEGRGFQKNSQAKGAKPKDLTFEEFFTIARQIRDTLHQKFAAECLGGNDSEKSDELAGTASLRFSQMDVYEKVKDLNYNLTPAVRDEILLQVTGLSTWDAERSLDFDEFFDYIFRVRNYECFPTATVAKLREVFDQYDTEHSGELNAKEMLLLFQELGYPIGIIEVEDLLHEVDVDHSGQLDFREYLRVMRLHSDRDLEKIRNVFDSRSYIDEAFSPREARTETLEDGPAMLTEEVAEAVSALGYDVTDMTLPESKLVDFDSFVQIVEAQRALQGKLNNERIDLSEMTQHRLQELFSRYDTNSDETVTPDALSALLAEFGREPTTRKAQEELVRSLVHVRQVGPKIRKRISILEIEKRGLGKISCADFFRLMEYYERDMIFGQEEHLAKVIEQLKFSDKEVADFRKVFHHWARSKVSESMCPYSELPGGVASAGLYRVRISSGHWWRLVRESLGVDHLSSLNKQRMERKMASLQITDGSVNWLDFLQLMRWMADTDYGGICSQDPNKKDS